MSFIKKFLKAVSPFQILVMGYLFITVSGAFLLSIPYASRNGQWQNYVDSLFMAASAISTTGLVVVDIGSFYTLFGQLVLMTIFQIGGIGYMSLLMFVLYLFDIKTSITVQLTAKESLSGPTLRILGKFFLVTVIFTLIFEASGAIVLALYWMQKYNSITAAYYGVFHSISAFCTAGFCLFPDSLMSYKDSIIINGSINFLSLAGGIGFIVLYETFMFVSKRLRGMKVKHVSVHTKVVLLTTFIIVITATLLLLVTEHWDSSISIIQRFVYSSFQVISASTTDGYNTIDIGAMSSASITIIMLLMFVGASPGSTGGGIKTTTFAIICMYIVSLLKGKSNGVVNIYEREIPTESINKALGIFIMFIIVTMIDLISMSMTEKCNFENILFEIISALGNTGLSTGITSQLSITGKVLLTVTMFIGRVGPITFGFFILGNKKVPIVHYAQEDIFVG